MGSRKVPKEDDISESSLGVGCVVSDGFGNTSNGKWNYRLSPSVHARTFYVETTRIFPSCAQHI